MEKIFFDNHTYIWKTKLNKVKEKLILLDESYELIKSMPKNNTDGFGYKNEWNTNLNFIGNLKIESKLDEIIQLGVDMCKKLYEELNITYNKINTDAWVNVVRSKNPIQPNFYIEKQKFHTHTEINKKSKSFTPNYTYVYYIQMPDIITGEDGVLYFKGKNNNEYWILPEEDDLIIMEADMPHAPNNAPNSNIDRIVLAGNVGFDYIKKQKSLI